MENLFIVLYFATMGILLGGVVFTFLWLVDPDFRADFREDWYGKDN